MDYDLSRLNSRSFEQLIQGVASRVLGPGLVVFGDGPDGGREAAFEGRVPYPTASENWEGSIVLQAKFRQRPMGTSKDGDWALQQLSKEFKAYTDPDSARILPDYLIYTTNVTLSPATGGAKDQIFELAEGVGLKGFDVWDYDKLRVYLDDFHSLRRAFAAYVLPGDVLAEVIDALDEIKKSEPDFDDVIARFLQKELLADRWANLEQAGRAAEEQVPVSRVFVDLPFSDGRQADPPEEEIDDLLPGFVAHVVEAAAYRLDPESLRDQRGAQENLDSGQQKGLEGRFVLLGGPGQGKSTLGQFVCQMFRAGILRTRPPGSLSPEVRDALDLLEKHCASDQLALPAVRRFPLRVELSKFAEELGRSDGVGSLLGFLAKMVSARVQREVSASLMSTWLSEYPWLLVLDGLDEVPSSGNREELMKAIQEFWVDVSQENADCLVIATTRPQGYNEEFSPKYYRHLWLTPLSTARALHYADRLLNVRILDDDDRRAKIAGRLERAVARPDTAHLMTSPLQVTIMATLLERMGQPPEGRWNLFSQYYRVIYDRELERDIPAASVLREYKPDIDAIHRRVGLLLQVESESADQTDAQISRERFSEIVISRLREEEHDFEENDPLVQQIIDTAMERLVFLVGLESDKVGFEIRSLQEFMAAEALLDGNDSIIEKRLRAIAALPSWRNVFLFAAGRCFADLQHLRDTVHTICVEADDPGGDPLASIFTPGARLAIDLLADGVANRQPRYERLLAREALRGVRMPPEQFHDELAEVYRPSLRKVYEEELRGALAVGEFQEALGAWRTLAVLGARSEGWAFELLESRLPRPDDLPYLTGKLSEMARSRWLAKKLAKVLVETSPATILPRANFLQGLHVQIELAPSIEAIVNAFSRELDWENEIGVQIRSAGSSHFNARVVPIRRVDDRLEEAAQAAGRAEAPPAWEPIFTMLGFLEAPSASSLADALRSVPDDELSAWQRLGSRFPWPLQTLLAAASDVEDLEEMAQKAEAGYFGDPPDWVAAEERWEDAGIEDSDLVCQDSDENYPFDARIAKEGFPLKASGLSIGSDRSKAASIVLRWLGIVTDSKLRSRLVRAVFWLLSRSGGKDGGSGFSAEELAEIIRPEDLDHRASLDLNAINKLKWGKPLSLQEGALLNEVGIRVGPYDLIPEPLDPDLFLKVIDAWRRDPDQEGIYRLMSLAMPVGGLPELDADDLLMVPLEGPVGAARALLGLNLGELPSAEMLEVLIAAGDPWLDHAIFALGQRLTADAEEGLGALNRLLSSQRTDDKTEIVSSAKDLIARRSSGLERDDVWESLELFERPSVLA